MASTSTSKEREPYFSSRRPGVVICMDDRPVDVARLPGDLSPADGEQFLYAQIGGGLHGISLSALTLRAIRVGLGGLANLHDTAVRTNTVLKARGILALFHYACAAEGSADDISTIVGKGEPELLRRTRQIDNTVSDSLFEQTVNISQSRDFRNRLWTPGGAPQSVQRVHLRQVEHTATVALVNKSRGQMLDVAGAFDNDLAAYCISQGDLPDLFTPLVDAGLSSNAGDVDSMLGISAITHAATIMALEQHTGRQIDIVAVG